MAPSILPESSATDDSQWHRDTACEPSKRNDKEVKAQQARKIRELGDALVLHGFCTLDQQAKALALNHGLPYSRLSIRNPASRSGHQSPFAAPRLPTLIRDKIPEHIDKKSQAPQLKHTSDFTSGKGFFEARKRTTSQAGNSNEMASDKPGAFTPICFLHWPSILPASLVSAVRAAHLQTRGARIADRSASARRQPTPPSHSHQGREA